MAVALAPDAHEAALRLSDGRVLLWEPGSLDLLGSYHEFGGDVRSAAFSADQRVVVTATKDSVVTIIPDCPLRGSVADLAKSATTVLEDATRMGLYDGQVGRMQPCGYTVS